MPPDPPFDDPPADRPAPDRDWRAVFPHAEPYPNQPDAITRVLDTLADRGFLSIEGACGTGKTVTALTAALAQLRAPDTPYTRVVAATPYKNQMAQFVSELRTINANSLNNTEQATGITMVGRTDLHPYLRENALDSHTARDALQAMQERTVELITNGSDITLDGYAGAEAAPTRDTWYDPNRAQFLCQQARNRLSGRASTEATASTAARDTPTTTGDALATGGFLSPYPLSPPETRHVVDLTGTTSRLDSDADTSRFDDYESGALDDATSDADASASPLPAELQGPFDPFFAGYYAQDPDLTDSFPLSFTDGDDAVLTTTDILAECIPEGICPHLAMSHLADDADVVIGNYYHVYDPMTRGLTQQKLELFTDGTVLIVDEAHNLESRAREMFSTTLAPHTLATARNDIRGALQLAALGDIKNLYTTTFNDDALDADRDLPPERADVRDDVRAALNDAGVTVHHLRIVHDLLEWIHDQFIPELASRHLDTQYQFSYSHAEFASRLADFDPADSDFQLVDDETAFDLESAAAIVGSEPTGLDRFRDTEQDASADSDPSLATNDDALTTSLRAVTADRLRDEPTASTDSPTTANSAETDSDTDDAAENDVLPVTLPGVLGALDRICMAAEGAWSTAGIDREMAAGHVGWTLDTWVRDESVAYYRELEVAFEPAPDSDDWDRWTDLYTPRLALHNTIPADSLGEMSAEVGSGVFMSATLEPHDVFQEVSGLAALADAHDRPTATATYGLRFPESNRASVIGALERYTSDNRGAPVLDREQMTPTRRQYADVLTGIAGTYGNILIAMPNYQEAEWLYDLLAAHRDELGKAILKDESSTYQDTQQLLDRFRADDDTHRVLTTGLRGTVTEGVDYPGDQLHTVVVVGVPIANIGSGKLQAVEDAYADRFGEDNAFDYTFAIPAVRKARQAVGRVIRSADDVGVRVLLDERYGPWAYNGVHQYLSDQERREFDVVSDPVEALTLFWTRQHSN